MSEEIDRHRPQSNAAEERGWQPEATQNRPEVRVDSPMPGERRRRIDLEEAVQCRELLAAAAQRAVAELDDMPVGPGRPHGDPLRWADVQWQAVVESVDHLIVRLTAVETEVGADRDPGEARHK